MPNNHPSQSSTVGKETCMDLFRVQANIPFNHAFSELSVMLGCNQSPDNRGRDGK